MAFIWPAMLLCLLLIPLGAGAYLLLQRRRQQLVARFRGFGLAQAAGGRPLGVRRHVPPALFLAGLAILLFALARPQTVVSLPRVEGTVILAFDVSGSMAADDLKPTRMEAAKAAARTFVERQTSGVLIGVVAFSEGGLAVQVPTNDQAAVLAAIDRLTPQRGTSLGQGMLAALNVLDVANEPGPRRYSTRNPTPTPVPAGSATSAAIVLLTDGENNVAPNPLTAAQRAAARGVRIYTVGIGSPAGTTLTINGFTIHTQLDEGTLQQVAQITQGSYYNVADQETLRTIYDNLDLRLVTKQESIEVTSLLTGAGTLVLLIGGICSLLWLSRVP